MRKEYSEYNYWCPDCWEFFDETEGSLCPFCDGNDWLNKEHQMALTLKSWLCTDLRAENERLKAAQAWHPASEPPERVPSTTWSREVLVKLNDGYGIDQFMYDINMWGHGAKVLGWRDLPPMPEEEA